MEWLRAHGLDPRTVHRVEVHEFTGTATVYEYQLDARGQKFYDPSISDAAQCEPRVVTVTSPPPLKPA
jgi:hypothetical protein